MALLIFAIVVILVAILCIMLSDALCAAASVTPPIPLVCRIIILLVAILAIANRAGFI